MVGNAGAWWVVHMGKEERKRGGGEDLIPGFVAFSLDALRVVGRTVIVRNRFLS